MDTGDVYRMDGPMMQYAGEERALTEEEQAALDYFDLDYAESDEPGAGWFAYTRGFEDGKNNYPGTSCECLEDVVRWYHKAQPR